MSGSRPAPHKFTCECGHKRTNHDPGCFWCACAQFTEWRETWYREYDWKGQKADIHNQRGRAVHIRETT